MADLKDLKRQEKNIRNQIKTRLKNMKKMEADLQYEDNMDDYDPYQALKAEVVELGEKLTVILEQIKEAKEAKEPKEPKKAKEPKEPKEPKKVTAFLARTVVDGRVQVANKETKKLAEDTFGEGKGFNEKHSQKLIESIQAVFSRVENWAHPNFNLIVAIYADSTASDVLLDGTTLIISSGKDNIDFQDVGEGLEYVMEETDLSYEEDLDAFDLASEIYTFYNS